MSALQLQGGGVSGQEQAVPGRPVAAQASSFASSLETTLSPPSDILRCSSPTSSEDVDNGGKCTARLSQLFNNPKFSDITLVVGRKRFFAHKLLLANASDVFE